MDVSEWDVNSLARPVATTTQQPPTFPARTRTVLPLTVIPMCPEGVGQLCRTPDHGTYFLRDHHYPLNAIARRAARSTYHTLPLGTFGALLRLGRGPCEDAVVTASLAGSRAFLRAVGLVCSWFLIFLTTLGGSLLRRSRSCLPRTESTVAAQRQSFFLHWPATGVSVSCVEVCDELWVTKHVMDLSVILTRRKLW